MLSLETDLPHGLPHQARSIMSINIRDIGWYRVSSDKLKELGIFPNSILHNTETNVATLVVLKSQRLDEFPLSQAGLN